MSLLLLPPPRAVSPRSRLAAQFAALKVSDAAAVAQFFPPENMLPRAARVPALLSICRQMPAPPLAFDPIDAWNVLPPGPPPASEAGLPRSMLVSELLRVAPITEVATEIPLPKLPML